MVSGIDSTGESLLSKKGIRHGGLAGDTWPFVLDRRAPIVYFIVTRMKASSLVFAALAAASTLLLSGCVTDYFPYQGGSPALVRPWNRSVIKS